MNYNFKVIYIIKNKCFDFFKFIRRVIIPDKNYFYRLFIFNPIEIYRYLPLQPYLNNTGFKL